MSCDSLYDGGVTNEDESRLFCTPPPDEVLAELDCWTDQERDAEGPEDLVGSVAPESIDCAHLTSSMQGNPNRLNCSPEDLTVMQEGKRSSQTQSRQPSNKFIRQLSRSSKMANTGRYITSFTNPFKRTPKPSANHVARADSGHSHLATSTSPKSKQSLAVTSLPKQPQDNSLLGHSIGYASSEEEVEQLPHKKEVKTPARASVKNQFRNKNTSHEPKLAKLTSTDSESEASIDISRPRGCTKNGSTSQDSTKLRANFSLSKARTSHKVKQSRTSSTNSEKAPFDSIPKSNQSLLPRGKMKSGVEANNKPTADGRKKRRASPKASMKDTKRPKTKGGFLMSDESEAGEYDDDSDGDDSEPAAPQPTHQRPTLGDRPADIEKPVPLPMPTKQLNKSRLNMLLGRNKNAQFPAVRNAQSNPTNLRTTTSQAPTYKQGNNQNGQNFKLAPVNSSACRPNVTPIGEGSAKSTEVTGKQSQMRNSLGSSLSAQADRKLLESDSVSRESSILSRPVNCMDNLGHRSSRPSTLHPTVTSAERENSSRGKGDNVHGFPREVANVRRTPSSIKGTGSVPSSISQARGSDQIQVEKAKTLPAVTPSKPLPNKAGQQPRPRQQVYSSGPESRFAEQLVHKQPSQASSRKPAIQAQSSNSTAASSSLSQEIRPNRPQNRTPNPEPTKGHPVATQVLGSGVGHGVQMAQKRKVEKISGGPVESAVPVKKPVVAPKSSSVSARPTTSERKGGDDGMRSSNSSKISLPTAANKASSHSVSTPQPQPKSSSTRGGSHALPKTDPLSRIPGIKTDKTISKTSAASDATHSDSLEVRASKMSSIKAAATRLSDKIDKSLSTPVTSPVLEDREKTAINTPRRTSVKDFFAPISSSKKPFAASNKPLPPAPEDTTRTSDSPDMKIIATSPRSFGHSIPDPSGAPRRAHSSPAATVENRNVKNSPLEPKATDGPVPNSIPSAVLYPSFSPAATVPPERASGVTSVCHTTAATVNIARIEADTQKTSQVAKTIETVTPAATAREDATKAPAKEATDAVPLPPRVSLKTAATQTDAPIPYGDDIVSTKPSDMEVLVCSPKTTHNSLNDPSLSVLSGVSEQPEPYFEYTVFQKIWSGEQSEDAVTATEIAARPSIKADEANSLTEQLFQNMREQYLKFLRVDFSEQTMKRDSQDCLTISGVFSPYDYQDQIFHVKIWVERNCVSKYANTDNQALKMTLFIKKEAYILRLFTMIPAPDASDVESDGLAKLPIRSYHKLPCNEVYTTLDAANRAARRLQIELAHVKSPKDDITTKWQEQNLAELNAKVHALDPSMGGEEGCWRSEFNACGKGGNRLELVVEKVGIAGPRN